MKAQKKISVTKIMDRFDSELKNILMNDLSAVKNTKANLVNTIQNGFNNRLNAA